MEYSTNDYCDMLICYGAAGRDAVRAAEEYAARYPKRRHPDADDILALITRALKTGKTVPPCDGTEGIITRSRRFAKPGEQIISTNEYIRMERALVPGDYPRRRNFCRWLVRQHKAEPKFTKNIFFTSECDFDRRGPSSYHAHNIYPNEPVLPRVPVGVKRLWAGIIGDVLIGPVVLEHELDDENYESFVSDQLQEHLEDLPLSVRKAMWFQHDDSPAHQTKRVRALLHKKFPGGWIGYGGTVGWPMRSPDLNPVDYFLWVHLNNHIYDDTIQTAEELQTKIEEAVKTIKPEMLENARRNLIRRANRCIELEGRTFHFLP